MSWEAELNLAREASALAGERLRELAAHPKQILSAEGKDIKIQAKGMVAIDAVEKIEVSSKADVAISGLNIENDAKVGFAAKGGATAELSASGQTTVKGAMVEIN